MSESSEQRVDYPEEGGAELETGKRYRVVFPAPPLRIGLWPPEDGLPEDAFALAGAKPESAKASEAAAGDDGLHDLEFKAPRSVRSLDCTVTPNGSEPYSLFEGRTRPGKADRLARAVTVTVLYRTESADDRLPVGDKVLLLKMGGGWRRFRTDDDGRLRLDGEEPGGPVWLLHPKDDPAGRPAYLHRGSEDCPESPPEEATETFVVEEIEEEDGELLFVGRLKRPPRISLTIDLHDQSGSQSMQESQDFSATHCFVVRIDGEEVSSGTHVEPDGKVKVSFRAERGEHQLVVLSVSKAGEQESSKAAREVVHFARQVTVR